MSGPAAASAPVTSTLTTASSPSFRVGHHSNIIHSFIHHHSFKHHNHSFKHLHSNIIIQTSFVFFYNDHNQQNTKKLTVYGYNAPNDVDVHTSLSCYGYNVRMTCWKDGTLTNLTQLYHGAIRDDVPHAVGMQVDI